MLVLFSSCVIEFICVTAVMLAVLLSIVLFLHTFNSGCLLFAVIC